MDSHNRKGNIVYEVICLVKRLELIQTCLTKQEGLNDENVSTELSSLAVNQIECDFDKLAPVSERIKLDGDEYDTGNKRQNKTDTGIRPANTK